jgi:hypothetical protein
MNLENVGRKIWDYPRSDYMLNDVFDCVYGSAFTFARDSASGFGRDSVFEPAWESVYYGVQEPIRQEWEQE